MGLRDYVVPFYNGDDGALLDCGGTFETVGVDSSEKFRLQVMLSKLRLVDDLVPIGFDLIFRDILKLLFC